MKITFVRLQGLVCLAVGILCVGMNILTILTMDDIILLFAAFPVFFLIGLSMIIFPGARISAKEVNGEFSIKKIFDPKEAAERSDRQFSAMNEAPILHKVMWIIAGVLGLALSVWLILFLLIG